jgi:uncharacterized protein YxjI
MNSFFSNLVGSQAPQPNFNLYPLPHAVGIIPAFSNHQHTVVLRMREQLSFTGDDYTIDDAGTGQPILRVTGKALSLRSRKSASCPFLERRGRRVLTGAAAVTDARGTPLFELRNALISLSRHWTAYQPGTEEVMFTVKAKMFSFKDAMTVYVLISFRDPLPPTLPFCRLRAVH